MKKFSDILGKFLMAIFLIILLFGLVSWGIGDVLTNTGSNTVASVGKYDVSSQEYDRLVSYSSNRMSQDLPDDVKQKILNYVKTSSIKQLINEKLIKNEADKLSLEIDGKIILKNEYLQIPSFTKEKLQQYIASEGGEQYFIEKIVNEKKSQILEGAITSLVPYTDKGYDAIYEFEKQTRNVKILEITDEKISEINQPTDSEIREFYEKHKNLFQSKEARNISYIVIDENAVKNDSEIDESGERDFSQGFNKITSEILDMLSAEKPLEEIAKTMNLKLVEVKYLNSEGYNDTGRKVKLPKVDGLLEAAFDQEEGLASDLLENEAGNLYAVVRVDSISDKRIKALDEVIPQVKKLWLQTEKEKKLEKLAKNIFEKLVENKTNIKQLSDEEGYRSEKISGMYRDYETLPPAFVKDIFSTNIDGYTNPYKVEKGKFLIAKIKDIDKSKEVDELEKLTIKTNIQEQLQQEIYAQYLAYLATKYKIKTDLDLENTN